jgi:cell division septation protein DedD
MPKNEDGEFELILGNRQLLSVFFIVVVLLGVFFTMGYIVGRNSSPAAPIEVARKADPKATGADRPSAASGPVTPVPAPQAAPESTSPAVSTPAAPPPQETPAPAPVQAPAPKKETKAPPPKPEPASPTPDTPTPGATYLQVAAVAKAEAELFVDVLAKKGFHALYTVAPIPNTYRVLVGPFQDAAAVSQARADLNKAGMKGFDAIVRRF